MTGFALSQTTPTEPFTYSLSVAAAGDGDAAPIRKGGRFSPLGGVPDTLASATLALGEGGGARIELVIRDRKRVLHRHQRTITLEELREAQRFANAEQVRDDGATSLSVSPDSAEVNAPVAVATAAEQAPEEVTADAPAVELEIDGLIIDETRTKPGRDFYARFYAAWQPPAEASDYRITLAEAPGRGRASRIDVQIDGTVVFRAVLQPREALIAAAAERAVATAANHLRQRDELRDQLVDPDQAGDGLY